MFLFPGGHWSDYFIGRLVADWFPLLGDRFHQFGSECLATLLRPVDNRSAVHRRLIGDLLEFRRAISSMRRLIAKVRIANRWKAVLIVELMAANKSQTQANQFPFSSNWKVTNWSLTGRWSVSDTLVTSLLLILRRVVAERLRDRRLLAKNIAIVRRLLAIILEGTVCSVGNNINK